MTSIHQGIGYMFTISMLCGSFGMLLGVRMKKLEELTWFNFTDRVQKIRISKSQINSDKQLNIRIQVVDKNVKKTGYYHKTNA